MNELMERVQELEIRLSFQDQQLLALDEVVRALADELSRLQAELNSVREQVSEGDPRAPGPADEIPPHW